MCGISGIVSQQNSQIKKEEIKQITDIIIHRGPDSEGFYFGDNFSLGFRRLAILDLSIEGNQPMYFDDKFVIIFNGEIYNYIEIKEELINAGYVFKTRTDTEVILAAYDFWGEGCVNHFNGMWAFTIYDRPRNLLFCSRDRYGVKPFYYSEINNRFVFGSEIKQILELHPERILNKEILIQFLIGFDEYDTKNTFFNNIYKLPPSHNLIYNLIDHTFQINRYYQLQIDESINRLNEKETLSLIEKEFERSIRMRLRSDVKVGTCLSGGLDSSSIAYYAASKYNSDEDSRRFSAIHAKSQEKKTDESYFATKVAQSTNLDLKVVEPTEDDFFSSLNSVIELHEEPFSGVSIFMQYFVFEEAKRVGCTVMLDGQGGDETFLGYERYYLPTLKYLTTKDKIRLLKNITKYTYLNYRQVLVYLMFYNFPSLYVLGTKMRRKLIKGKYLRIGMLRKLSKNLSVYKDINKLQQNELFHTVLPHLLKVEDKNSMFHSVESRLPFLDYKLIETLFSVDNKLKVKDGWTKYLMRKMVTHKLPDEIVWRRKKIGFAAPSNLWLKNKEKFISQIKKSQILKEVLRKIPENLEDGMVWKLYNISMWEEIFDVKIR